MRPRTILVVDDEQPVRRAVRDALADDETRVVEARDAASAQAAAASHRPDLVVLDLGLPDAPGLQLCQELRTWTDTPILVLSARHSDDEKVRLFDAGADDYLTKPFSTIELKARVRALFRRNARAMASGGGTVIRSGGLVIDLSARRVSHNGRELHLTPIEWDLLRVMAVDAGRTLTHRQLFTRVWSSRSHGDAQQYLRVHVANLRRKIEPDVLRPRYIVTEPGVGYRFIQTQEPE